MEQKPEIKPKHLAIAAGAGLVIGAIVVMLWTPKSGKEVRKSITEKIDSLKEKVKKKKDGE